MLKATKKTTLSTADVARLFNVTETTVKRWADDGTLKCQKTPGGHRKFLMRYVAEFASAHNLEPTGALTLRGKDAESSGIEIAVLGRDYTTLTRAFIEKALSPDVHDLYHFFSYLYQNQVQLWEIYDHILSPGMREIGERWMRGEIGVNHEHRASYEVLDALAKLQAQVLIKPSVGRSVVCACLEDELHEIGLRCAAYLFESEGWKVHYLGARTPADSLIAAVDELRPSVVCVSVTNPGLEDTRRALKDVDAACRDRGVRLVLGGRALGQDRLSGDSTFATAHELLTFMHRYVREHRDGNGRRAD